MGEKGVKIKFKNGSAIRVTENAVVIRGRGWFCTEYADWKKIKENIDLE